MPSLICRLSVRAFSPSRVRRLALLASACALALAPGRGLALSLSQENFEQASDGTNYVVLGEHGLGDPFIDEYFKRGTNGDFSMGLTLLNLHGTNFWAGEDTDFDGPGECRVTVRALDVRGFQNLRATWALAIGRDAAYGGTPFESSDYMILQTALDGSAWTNVSVFRGPASSGYLREDTNKDGIGDGTQLTRTFQDFQANVSGLGTGLQVRVILYMNSPDEEAAFDDIRVTGDPIPPIITITNPAQDLAVTESVSTYTVQGTANLGVVELIAWTNSLTGLQGTIPAATNWSIPGISLGVGVNTITVSGSNTVGQVNSKNVSINRVLPPTLSITVPPSTLNVPDTTTALNLAGVANTYVAGSLRWTNALTGATGSVPAATNWTITGVGLALGTNVITVTGTNIVQQSASAAVSVYRVPLPALAITSPTSGVAVAHDVTTITVSGTASAEAFGLLRWTNSLTGGTGITAPAANWSLLSVPIGLGTNAIVVTASNIVGRAVTATVQVYRVEAPVVTITNPAAPIAVSDLVTTYSLQGSANAVVGGLLRWTNSLTGGVGSGAAATTWTLAAIPLGFGTNAIAVTGSNIVNRTASSTASIYRVPLPALAITSPTSGVAVAHDVTTITVSGTASAEAFGLLRWTNSLTGGTGSTAPAANWSLLSVPIGLGTNAIVVTASNIVGRAVTTTVQVYRVAAPIVTITNPAASSAVSALVTTVTVQGTANSVVGGLLRWTNSLTGGAGTGTAGASWTIAAIPLGLGTNAITVTGSNIVSRTSSASVSMYRVPDPVLAITDPAAPPTVANNVSSRSVSGTANAVVGGLLSWSNGLTGATGTAPAATNWLIASVPLAPGLNAITVLGSNVVGRLVTVQTTVAREGAVLLNEILANPVGADAATDREFIELLQVAGGGPAGDLSLVEISGNAADKGTILGRWDLTGLTFGTNGLLLVGDNYATGPGGSWSNQVSPHTGFGDAGYAPDGLQNTSITLLLVRNSLPAVFVGADLDANNDGILDSAPWSELVDGAGWTDGGVGDVVYGVAALAQSADWPDAATRSPTNRVPQDRSAWYNGDVMTAGADTLGRTYNPAAASANLPAGAVLTPGRSNVPSPTDQDGDSLPNAWEQQYFGGTTNSTPDADPDGDGESNQAEYWAGTDPTNASSFFEIGSMASTGTVTYSIYTNGDVVTQALLTVESHRLEWASVSNRMYRVYGKVRMDNPFNLILDNVPATPPLNTYTSALGASPTYFYGISVMEPVYP